MKKQCLIISSFFYLMWLGSCETIIDVEIPDKDIRLVLNSVIGIDHPIRGNVSLSRFILADEPFKLVEEAQVSLYENDQLLQSTFTDAQGNFTFEIKPEETKEYTLTVDKEGYSSVEASAHVPMRVDIQSVEVDQTALEKEIGCKGGNCPEPLSPEQILRLLQGNVEFTLHFQDQGSQRNFYAISTLIQIRTEEMMYQEDGNMRDTILLLNFPGWMETRDPAVSSEEELQLEDDPIYGDEFIFDDDIFNGKPYGFKFKVSGNGFYPQGKILDVNVLFRLKSMSEEQYLYIRSRESQDENEGNPFAEPVPIFNNVKNGFGIFAAYTMYSKPFPEYSTNN